ncbi:MAG: beta-phosphoglucomutase family hydrolase [Bacteroidota bacterium]
MLIPIYPSSKALIFDLDGTLADTMPAHRAAWVKTAAFFGAEMTEEMVQAWAGMASYKIAGMLSEKFNLALVPEEVSKKKAEYFFELQGSGVDPVAPLCDLAKANFGKLPMGVGTGSRRANAEKILSSLGIREIFDSLVTADDVINHKPSPDTFLKCANQLGIAPADCQVFEDADFGVRAAKSAGMKVVDIRNYL